MRNDVPPIKTTIIKPPASTTVPIRRYLARKLDPSTDNIKVKDIANISGKRTIVRVSMDSDKTRIKEN